MHSLLNIFLVSLVLYGFEVEANVRVPAEWEPHAATWMQWPGPYETHMRPAFANIIQVIQAYETLHLLTRDQNSKAQAQSFLQSRGIPLNNIIWHTVPIENSWMRDNGPIYVTENGALKLQNWGFDAWGGNFGLNIPFEDDDDIPNYVGNYLNMPVEDHSNYILERGNFETNGEGLVVLNWDCQSHRNPQLSQAQHEQIIRQAFGANQILWAYGHVPEDLTTGHIDGICRFVSTNTLVISDTGANTELDLADDATELGLNVVWYPGDPNWLVGNGFIAAMASNNAAENQQMKQILEDVFPNRDVYMVNAASISESGGGIHCVTNDQPLL